MTVPFVESANRSIIYFFIETTLYDGPQRRRLLLDNVTLWMRSHNVGYNQQFYFQTSWWLISPHVRSNLYGGYCGTLPSALWSNNYIPGTVYMSRYYSLTMVTKTWLGSKSLGYPIIQFQSKHIEAAWPRLYTKLVANTCFVTTIM